MFPTFMRNWENYPSGRTYERITRFDSKGSQVSIARIAAGGLVEYILSTQIETDDHNPFVEFSGPHFGRLGCGRAEFDALRAQMDAFREKALEYV
jgi:hypothetical protein